MVGVGFQRPSLGILAKIDITAQIQILGIFDDFGIFFNIFPDFIDLDLISSRGVLNDGFDL